MGVFVWHCDDSAPTPFIYSSGLKYEKGLQHLLDAKGFKLNRIKVLKNGVLTYVSGKDVWWSNPVEELPISTPGSNVNLTNGGSLPGKIFFVQDQRISGRFTISEDKISVVVLPQAKLSLASGTSPLITAGTFPSIRYFLWLEGEFHGGNQIAISTDYLIFSRLNLIKLKTTNSTALKMSFPYRTYVSHFKIIGGIDETNGYKTIYHEGLISGGNSSLINYSGSTETILSNVTAANSGSGVVNGSTVGYLPDFSLVQNLSIVNTRDDHSLHFFDSSNTDQSILVHGLLLLNSGPLYQNKGGGIKYSQVIVGMPIVTDPVINFSSINGADNSFSNNLVLSHANCTVLANARDTGITDGTCALTAASDGQMTVGFDLSKVFDGKVTTDDLTNLSDTLGLRLFDQINDWLGFSNIFRTWGKEGGVFPDATNEGPCVSGQNCRIWDYRLKADSANIAYNRSDLISVQNGNFIPGATCPSAVSGNKTTDFTTSTPNKFLTNAQEIFDDGVGDNDGLCESNEACLYNPNIGAYQGEGDFYTHGTCIFTDGAVVGVKMYARPTNGL